MLGYDWPRLHAALNDLPAALLVVAVLFDLAGWATRRDSLKAAALWTLWAGVIGGWAAVLAGLKAAGAIEHGEAIHDLMKTHQTWGLVTMGVFTAILAYKLLRRAALSPAEELGVRVLALAGLAGVLWTGTLGGKLMFEHAAGIPSALIRAEVENRAAGHEHDSGDVHAEAGEAGAQAPRDGDSTHQAAAESAKAGGHPHRPGTAPHKH